MATKKIISTAGMKAALKSTAAPKAAPLRKSVSARAAAPVPRSKLVFKPVTEATQQKPSSTVVFKDEYVVTRREPGGPTLPMQLKPSNPKDAIASTKLPLHLWPATATAMGCVGLLDGALKYGQNNYRATGAKASVYVGAALRHLQAWNEGQDLAPDSGVPHLANALACLAILVDCQAAGNLVDDRCFPGGYHELVDQLTDITNQLQAERAHLNPHHYTKQDVA